jgi:hypothetical protein
MSVSQSAIQESPVVTPGSRHRLSWARPPAILYFFLLIFVGRIPMSIGRDPWRRIWPRSIREHPAA